MALDRKAAVSAYKHREVRPGIFAIRCAPSGQVWLGQAPDMDAIQNRHWLQLDLGTHRSRTLQDAWTTHGKDGFAFEIVELVAPDEAKEAGFVLDIHLKHRLAALRSELGAELV